MTLDIPTLALVISLLFMTQVFALIFQHKGNKKAEGIDWWLTGSLLLALGFIFMPLLRFKPLEMLARIANPLVVMGHLFLYWGILNFLQVKRNKWVSRFAYLLFLFLYYYFMYVTPEIRGRTVVVSWAVALIALLSAYELLLRKGPRIGSSANFTAVAFLIYGGFFTMRAVLTILLPPAQSYSNMPPIYAFAYVVIIVTSTLWTFGFILMVNQRLHAENVQEKRTLERMVAERMVVEEELRESEETYRSILNASPDDITITDYEGRILLVSPMANVMFGYQPGEGAGMTVLDCVAAVDQERALANIMGLHQGTRTGTHGYRGLRKDGTTLDIEVNSGLIRGPQGQVAKMVFVIRDVTRRKQLDASKAEWEDRNRQFQKAESLGRMAGAIAHHLNNQMQVVLGNLEVVSMLPRDSKATLPLTRVKQAAEHAVEVSKLLLIYLGQTFRKQKPCALAELCHASLAKLQAGLPEGVALELDFPAPGPVITANAEQVQQILAGLVNNAREAIGASRGSIRIGLRTVWAADLPTAQRFPVNWQPQGPRYATLEVADTGCGIVAEDIEKLFDPFFSTKFTGRGLGLSVVLGFVQVHAGAVSVTSQPGHGSVFRVHFPVPESRIPD